MKKILVPFVLILAALIVGPVAYAALPGSAIAPPAASGSGGAPTPQSVTTATVLTGTDNKVISIDGAFDGAITLPAASGKRGQTITITDFAGVCSGESTGASSSIIYTVVSNTGTETISAPTIVTPRTRLLCWKRYASVTLVSDGTSAWHATTRVSWHVDPRTISGLEAWYDSRRGITLNSTVVSGWNDLSGNTIHLTQGTGADQPQYVQSASALRQNGENVIRYADTTDALTSTSTVAITSGSVTLVGAYVYNFARAAGTERLFQSAVTGSLGFYWSLNDSAPPGGAASGAMTIAANNTAITALISPTSTVATLKSTTATVGGMRRVDIDTVGTGIVARINDQPTNTTAAAGGTVTSFTQTLQVGNSIASCLVMQIMLFDAAVSAADATDLYNAIRETYGETQ